MYASNVRTRLGVYSSLHLEVDPTSSTPPQMARVILECQTAQRSAPFRDLEAAASLVTAHVE